MTGLLQDRYHLRPAAAFVRGLSAGSKDHPRNHDHDPRYANRDRCCSPLYDQNDHDCVARALDDGVDLHRFKRSALARVRRVLGMLEGLAPRSLLDIGCGRGAFIWPLLDRSFGLRQLIALEQTAFLLEPLVIARRGGLAPLIVSPLAGDVAAIPLAASSVQVVTILEVLEHLQRPMLAAQQAVRVAAEHVIVSVPSKPDDNPQHIQLFDGQALTRLFLDAGARRVQLDYVLNHIVLLASLV